MYKILFFLHKSDDKDIISLFKEKIVIKLSEIVGMDVKTAVVESNLLLEQKYSHYCEISAKNKEELDILMHSKAGKELNKELTDFHKNLTVITVNYGD
jgi:hypothetical protein